MEALERPHQAPLYTGRAFQRCGLIQNLRESAAQSNPS